MFESLHLLRPWWLVALLPLLIVMWRLYYSKVLSNSWQRICDPGLLQYLTVKRQKHSSRSPLYLLGLAWLFTVIALSGPTWSRTSQRVYRAVHGDVIVFDLSPNMLADDIKPARLQRAKFKLIDLLNALQDSAVGLVAFSGDAYTVAPITQDATTITAMVPEMSPNIMPTIGQNMAAGLQQGNELLQRGGINHGNLILITSSSADTAAIAEAKKLATAGITIDVLAIGTTEGAPIPLMNGGFLKDSTGNLVLAKLDPTSLQEIANVSGGQFVTFSKTNDDIKTLIASNTTINSTQSIQSAMTLNLWQDQGRWLLILVILLALFAFRRGWFEEIVS